MAEHGYHMTTQARSARSSPDLAPAKEEQQAIVLYSPDMDYCMSLRLLFQDRYTMITTTDANMLVTIVNAFQPDLVIIDALPTQRMRHRVELMKRNNADMRVMFFTTQRVADHEIHEFLQTSVDAVFSKPVDLAEITERIRALVEHATA
jgi:DNA-binding response OmpR family regulator